MKAWHFTGETLRNGEAIPAVGEWLKFKGEIIPCQQGLHASLEPWDALKYAPGSLLHLVELRGDKKREIKKHGSPVDKVAGCQRKIIATVDVEELLRKFARECALEVIHLWNAPEVVREYLGSGDESIRAAAGAAAGEAARDAAGAAGEAARDAAGAAAWAAAWAAARAAAWDAARDAGEAARAAAWDAAGATARAAARDAQRKKFNKMVYREFGLDESCQEKES